MVGQTVDELVRRQADIGVDVVSDGEVSKPGFVNFTGFGGVGAPWALGDMDDLPELVMEQYGGAAGQHILMPECVGPISYVGQAEVQQDIARLRHAVGQSCVVDVLAANVAAYSFEGANPQHEHEWTLFEKIKLEPDKVIIPGVIDTKTNLLEHPELVAQRIERYAGLVGRERVIAGTDCGFGTFVGFGAVHPKVAWLKLGSLVQGAQLASKHLWSLRARCF